MIDHSRYDYIIETGQPYKSVWDAALDNRDLLFDVIEKKKVAAFFLSST